MSKWTQPTDKEINAAKFKAYAEELAELLDKAAAGEQVSGKRIVQLQLKINNAINFIHNNTDLCSMY